MWSYFSEAVPEVGKMLKTAKSSQLISVKSICWKHILDEIWSRNVNQNTTINIKSPPNIL